MPIYAKMRGRAAKSARAALLAAFCLFIPTRSFSQEFSVSTLGDYGNVTVMEVEGNYDAGPSIDSFNEPPRQAVAKEFLKTHRDEYDFLVIFTNFDFEMPEAAAKAFYHGVKNDTRGIGNEVFDNTDLYGSNGRLQGTIDMGDLARIATDPLDPQFNDVLNTLSHEMMHRWAAHVKFRGTDGAVSPALLGRDGSHWSFLLDSGGSLMYGNRWRDNGNGTFTSTTPQDQMKFYSPLDLYLMGMIGPEKVPPLLLIENPSVDPARLPEAGITVGGTARTVTIEDIVAAEGARSPDASSSQKAFKTAFILLARPGTFRGEEVYGIENVRNGAVTRFSVLADGAAIMQVASLPREDVPANPGVVPPQAAPRNLPPDIEDGVRWLMQNQREDGSWADLPQTTERDTAEATLVLRNFEIALENRQNGLRWLRETASGNMDFLARKTEALAASGEDGAALLQELLARQNADGGWGSGANYASNPTDTALALKSLAASGAAAPGAVSRAVEFLKRKQNSDGGWGNDDKGSTVQATSHVLTAFTVYRKDHPLDDRIGLGTAMLLSRQNADGGFGNSPSTVYDTAMAVLALQETAAPPELIRGATTYLLGRQAGDGSWNGSAYQTALAVDAILQGLIAPDLAITSGDITFIPAAVRSLPANVTVQANIWNHGRVTVPQAKVALYGSFVSEGTKIAEQAVSFPGQQATTVTFSTTIADGEEHRYLVVVDPDGLVEETNETNNTAGNAIRPETTYDFEVLPSNVSVSRNPVDLFTDVTITAKIANKGTMNAFNVQVKYTVGGPGAAIELARHFLDIPANSTVTDNLTWSASRAGADLPLTVTVDPFDAYAELEETNNTASAAITVNELAGPNLTVSYRDITVAPNPAREGGDAVITALVKNEGTTEAVGITVKFLKGVPGQGSTVMDTRTVPSLAPGESASLSLDWSNIGESGERYIAVQADPDQLIPELREDDNDAFVTVTILGLPDLAVSPNAIAFAPPAPRAGDPVTITVTVQNKGAQNATNVDVLLSEDGAAIGSRTIPLVAGNSVAGFSLVYDTAGREGPRTITATVDPDHAIAERDESNNSASKSFTVQDADLWVTERYISPNGDGVQDRTTFSFRLEAATAVTVGVVNGRGETVRVFGGPEPGNTASGAVTWDGLDAEGRVVPDGNYTLEVRSPNGVVGSLPVVVDNNRSLFAEAIGTKYLYSQTAPVSLCPGNLKGWLGDDSGILLLNNYNQNNGECLDQNNQQGLYLISPGGDMEILTPAEWFTPPYDTMSQLFAEASADGEMTAVTYKAVDKTNLGGYNSDHNTYYQLWVVDNRSFARKMLVENSFITTTSGRKFTRTGFIGKPMWSPDGGKIAYTAMATPDTNPGYYDDNSTYGLFVMNADGTGKVKIDDFSSLDSAYYSQAKWSPGGGKLAYLKTDNDTSLVELWISDLFGNKQRYSLISQWYFGMVIPADWLDEYRILMRERPDFEWLSYQVRIVDTTTGSNQYLFAQSLYGDYGYSLSPDRSHLIIYSYADYSVPGGLAVFDLRTYDKTLEITLPYGYSGQFLRDRDLWSPDGKRFQLTVSNQVCLVYEESGDCVEEESYVKTVVIDLESMESKTLTVIGGRDSAWLQTQGSTWLDDNKTIFVATEGYQNGIYGRRPFLLNTGTGEVRPGPGGQQYISDLSRSPGGSYLDIVQTFDWLNNDYRLTLLRSLLNLTADLWASKQRSGVALKGTAADLNFAGYKLEYEDRKARGTWNLVQPPSDVPVVNDTLATWAPPAEGTYSVRLTVWDKAGNARSARKRVSWGGSARITNLYKTSDLISPNDDGVKDAVELHYRVLEPVHLEFTVHDENGRLIRTILRDHVMPGEAMIAWDGRNEIGSVVPDGKYSIKVLDYVFYVGVDTTLPDANIIVFPLEYHQETYVAPLAGHAVDLNFSGWSVEYGDGNNPKSWIALTGRHEQLVARDEAGNPLLDPVEDDLIVLLGKDFGPYRGKKFRITAEDFAGNTVTKTSGMLEERVILWTSPGANLAVPEKHTLQRIVTTGARIATMMLQQKIGDSWVDAQALDDPDASSALFLWDNRYLSRDITAIRLKGLDDLGLAYYSNEVPVVPQFYLKAACNMPTIAMNGLPETLTSLAFQFLDPASGLWKDYAVYDAQRGDSIPVNAFKPPLPQVPKGERYMIRMAGTGESGTVHTTAPDLYPAPCPVDILLTGEYDEAACGTVSGKAKLSSMLIVNGRKSLDEGILNSTLVSLQTPKYYIETENGPVPVGEGWTFKTPITVDTRGLPQGTYTAKVVLPYIDLSDNSLNEAVGTTQLVVDRVLPDVRITYPTASSKFCAVKYTDQGGDRYGIPVEGIVADDTKILRYELSYGTGEQPQSWSPALAKNGSPDSRITGKAPVRGQIGVWDVTGLPGEVFSLKLSGVDGSGNTSCFSTSFSVDTLTEIVKFAASSRMLSPNGDGYFDDVRIDYEINEYSTVDAKVYATTAGPDGSHVPAAAPLRTLLSGALQPPGAESVLWDGTNDGGAAVPDGTYAITLFATDSCGNTGRKSVFVTVDTTPPSAEITYPRPADSPGGIVEVRGTAEDLHFGMAALEIGQSGDPDAWLPVGTVIRPVKDGPLGTWKTYGLDGKWTLRLTATDGAGNKSVSSVIVDLAMRPSLLKDMDAAPKIFSPNGDGTLDTTTLTYTLTDTSNVSIEIFDETGVFKKRLVAGDVPAGTSTYVWDGVDYAGAKVADGNYTLKLTTVLPTNTSVVQTESLTVTVDTKPPVVVVTRPGDGLFLRTDAGVVGTISDINLAGYSVAYTGGEGAVAVDSGSQSRENYTFGMITGLPEGSYTLHVEAEDLAGNKAGTDVSFGVDGTAPLVTLSSPADGDFFGAAGSDVAVAGGIVEKNLESYSLRYGRGDDPGQWTDLSTGTSLPVDTRLFTWKVGKNDGVPDGPYTLSLFAKDKSGLTGEARVGITVDNTPPEVTMVSPKEGAYVKSAVDVTGTADDLNFGRYSVEISEGPCDSAYQWATIMTGAGPVRNGTLASWQALPPDGEYCLRTTAADKAGGAAEAKAAVTVDTHPPAAPELTGAVEGRTGARLEWTQSPEPDLAGYNLYRGGQKLNTDLILETASLDQGLTEGTYSYTVRAVDRAGWESGPSNEVSMRVDLTGPNARISSPSDGATVGELLDVKGTAYSADDFREYRVSVGQGGAPAEWNVIRTSPVPVSSGSLAEWDTTGTPNGPYTIRLEAEDLSGNITSRQATVTVDNTLPQAPVLVSAEADGSYVTLVWNPPADADVAGYLLFRNDRFANAASSASSGDWKRYLISCTAYLDLDLPDGTFTYSVVAVDGAGNTGEPSNSLDVTIDTRVPHATIVKPANSAKFGTALTVEADSPDLDIAAMQFQYKRAEDNAWTDLGDIVTASPYGAPLDPAGLGFAYGDYDLRVIATDKGGKTDPSPVSVRVTYTDLTAPGAPVLQALTNGNSVALSWTPAGEPDLAGYNVYRTSGTTRIKINTALVTGSAYQDAGLPDGDYAYDITAVDTFNNESLPGNSAQARVYAPALAQPQTPTAKTPVPLEGVNATASSAVELFVQDATGYGLRGTATADATGKFKADITLTPGENRITARATDGSGNVSRASAAVVVLYDEAPAAPTGLAASVEHSTVTLSWDPNPETDLAGYNVYRNAGQEWIKITETAVPPVSYADTNLPNGAYTYRITAVDSIGSESPPSGEATATVNIALLQPPANVAVASGPDGELNVSWDYSGAPAAGYNLYRGTVSGGPYTKVNGPLIPGRSSLDTGLTSGTTYYYVVTAVDAPGNESAQSQEGTGTAHDTTPPSRPEITSPTRPGAPVLAAARKTDVSGTSEAGTTVELFQNGVSAGKTATEEGYVSQSFTLAASLSGAALSPDGLLLAYSANGSVWTRDLSTSTATRIVTSGNSPVWSRDGGRIAYQYIDDDTWNDRVGIYELSTRRSLPVNDDPYGYEYEPSLSGDGSVAAFKSYDYWMWTPTIWVKDLASGSLTQAIDHDVEHPRLSPDGRRLAYFENRSPGSTLYVLDLSTGETTAVAGNTDGQSLDWSPDGRQVVYASLENGAADLYVFASDTGGQTRLTSSGASERLPVWMSDGRRILYAMRNSAAGKDAIMIAASDGSGQATAVRRDLPGLTALTATLDGGIGFLQAGGGLPQPVLTIARTGALFTFAGVLLEPGENSFHAVAFDSAENESPASEPITVTFEAQQMPDLTATTDDVVLYPSVPVAGETMTIGVNVGNRGQAGAVNVDVSVYLWNALDELELLESARIPFLGAGTSAPVNAVWDSTGKAGENRLIVVIDADDTVAESVESNNLVIRDFYAAQSEGVAMSTSLDADRYGSNQEIRIHTEIRNSGRERDATLERWIEDENGAPVTTFAPVSTGIPYASERNYDQAWNAGSTLAGAYRVRAVLKDPSGVLAENAAVFAIAPDMALAASVVTDKAAYGPRENANIGITLRNDGTNCILPEVRARVTIVDAAGTPLFSEEKSFADVFPGAALSSATAWNTGLTLPGDYRAVLDVSLDGQLLMTKSAGFKILSVTAMSGTIAAEPTTVPIGSPVRITAAVTNSGNADSADLAVKIMIVDPETQAIMDTHEEVIVLAKTATWRGTASFPTEQYGLKTYTAVLQTVSQGVVRNIGSAGFAVNDLTPPAVTVASPVPDGTYNAKLAITATAVDNASGIGKVEYQMDGGQWKLLPVADPSQGRYSTTWEPTIADNGPHTVGFRASDRTGNVSAVVPVGFVVQMDTVPPVTSIVIGTPKYELSGQLFVAGSTVITLSAEDNFAGVARTEYRIDGGPWTLSGPFTPGPEGSHLIEYRSEDKAGNLENAKSLEITVDNTPPDSMIHVGTPLYQSDGKTYISGATVITLDAADAGSGVQRTEYGIDGGPLGTYSGAFTLAAMDEGSHTITYRSLDNLGNTGSAGEILVTTDKTPPATVITASEPLVDGAVNVVSPATFFTLSAADGLSGVRTVSCRIDDGAWQSYTGSFPLSGMSAGPHTVSYKAADNVLNEETERTLAVLLVVLDVKKNVDASPVVLVGAGKYPGCEGETADDTGRKCEAGTNTPGCKLPDACRGHETAGKRALEKIADILSAAGIARHIAEDEDDFRTAFRSGKYNTYVLADWKEADLGPELRESAHSGAGLIFIKTKPDTDPFLDDVFGVKFTGKTTDSDLVIELIDSPISNEGTLEIADKSINMIQLQPSAREFGRVNDRHESRPVIVHNLYGRGRTMLFGFDLLSVQSEAQAAALLVNSVNYVRTLEHPVRAMDGAPVRIQVINASAPADIEIREVLPAGAKAIEVSPEGEQTGNRITWRMSLSENSGAVFGYVLELPDADGDFTATTEVWYGNNGEYRIYGTYPLPISIVNDSSGLLQSAILDLSGFTSDRPEDFQKAAKAVRELLSIDRDGTGKEESGKNIDRILAAINEVRSISTDMVRIRLALDELLDIWKTKWYLSAE